VAHAVSSTSHGTRLHRHKTRKLMLQQTRH
jgi:hypothetical protein